jgi:hypothetical protein
MVEGYWHEAGENLLELPGGFIEENEEPSQATKESCLKKLNITAIVLNL